MDTEAATRADLASRRVERCRNIRQLAIVYRQVGQTKLADTVKAQASALRP